MGTFLRRMRGFAIATRIDAMKLRIVATLRPFASALVRFASFDTSTARNLAVALLSSHRTFCACLALLGHRELVGTRFVDCCSSFVRSYAMCEMRCQSSSNSCQARYVTQATRERGRKEERKERR